jgi:hypothetical protein
LKNLGSRLIKEGTVSHMIVHSWITLVQMNARGEPHGRGLLVLSDGTAYTGQYINGKRHGFGVWSDLSGAKYEGEWRNDEKCGEGVDTASNGDEYSGQLKVIYSILLFCFIYSSIYRDIIFVFDYFMFIKLMEFELNSLIAE